MSERRQIVCSSGAMARWHSVGLWLDLEQKFPEHDFHMFDHDIVVRHRGVEHAVTGNLERYAENIQKVITFARKFGGVTIAAHSRGTWPVGMVDLSHVENVLLINPALPQGGTKRVAGGMSRNIEFDPERMVADLRQTDALTGQEYITQIDSDYHDSLKVDRRQLLINTIEARPTTIVRAENDKLCGLKGGEEILHPNATYIDIPGEGANHLLTGVRDRLEEELRINEIL